VVGAVSFEIPAAEQALQAMGITSGLAESSIDMSIFAGIIWTMSIGIIWGLLLCLFGGLNIVNKRMNKMQDTDKKWGEIFVSSLFMGLVATFCGSIITPPIVKAVARLKEGATDWAVGFTGILTLITSAFLMVLFTNLSKKENAKWLENFALPLSMLISMAMAIVYTFMLGGSLV
jgi:hypothetical protein